MKNLDGKTAIVAGGARDIGRAISEKLAACGAKVVVNYHSSEAQATETIAAIKAAGGAAIAVRGDMTRQVDVENVVSATRKAFGDTIDILVNVVGGLVARKSLAEMDVEFFESVMRLNVTSTFLTSKFVVPHMPSGGAIVNLSSLAGRDGGGSGGWGQHRARRFGTLGPLSMPAGGGSGRREESDPYRIRWSVPGTEQ